MQIKTLIKTFIEKKAQLIEVIIEDNNTDYFIDKIEKNINNKLSFATNVKGEMTDWKLFNEDKNFNNVLNKALTKNKLEFPPIGLFESWGIKILKQQCTDFHDHENNKMSGIFYLNDCKTPLEFPEIDIKIYPKKNSFLLFDAFLKHGTSTTSDEVKYAIACNFQEKKQWESQTNSLKSIIQDIWK